MIEINLYGWEPDKERARVWAEDWRRLVFADKDTKINEIASDLVQWTLKEQGRAMRRQPPVKLIESYRCYLFQCLKDFDKVVSLWLQSKEYVEINVDQMADNMVIEQQVNYMYDSMLSSVLLKGQPWMWTASFFAYANMLFINNSKDITSIEESRDFMTKIFKGSLANGSLMSIENYAQTATILCDIIYSSNWRGELAGRIETQEDLRGQHGLPRERQLAAIARRQTTFPIGRVVAARSIESARALLYLSYADSRIDFDSWSNQEVVSFYELPFRQALEKVFGEADDHSKYNHINPNDIAREVMEFVGNSKA